MYELIPEYEESDLRNDFTFSKGRLSVLEFISYPGKGPDKVVIDFSTESSVLPAFVAAIYLGRFNTSGSKPGNGGVMNGCSYNISGQTAAVRPDTFQETAATGIICHFLGVYFITIYKTR